MGLVSSWISPALPLRLVLAPSRPLGYPQLTLPGFLCLFSSQMSHGQCHFVFCLSTYLYIVICLNGMVVFTPQTFLNVFFMRVFGWSLSLATQSWEELPV